MWKTVNEFNLVLLTLKNQSYSNFESSLFINRFC